MIGNDGDPKAQADEQHQKMVQDIDDIKKYVAGTYSKVDAEVDEILKALNRIEKQLRETDNQVDRIEKFEQQLRNIESTLRNIERRIK